MSAWLKDLLDATVENEAPERYIYFAGLTAISAVCRKNVWLDRRYYLLYPNIYVFLIGPSGIRKGFPIKVAKDLVEGTKATRVISGRYSIPAAVRELGKIFNAKNGILKEAHGFLCNSELDSSLVKDMDSFSVLTDLYDCHWNKKWDNWLKSGDVNLTDPYLVILGGSNEANLHNVVPPTAIKGGFVARTIHVVEEKKRTISSLLDPLKKAFDLSQLSKRLHKIMNLKGEFIIEDNAKKLLEEYYKTIEGTSQKDDTGTIARLFDTVLKVAMLLSLSEKDSLKINEQNASDAIDKCNECVAGVKKVYLASGKEQRAEKLALTVQYLLRRDGYKATRQQILSRFLGDMDYIDLDAVIETLQQSGALDVLRHGSTVIYRLKENWAVELQKFNILGDKQNG